MGGCASCINRTVHRAGTVSSETAAKLRLEQAAHPSGAHPSGNAVQRRGKESEVSRRAGAREAVPREGRHRDGETTCGKRSQPGKNRGERAECRRNLRQEEGGGSAAAASGGREFLLQQEATNVERLRRQCAAGGARRASGWSIAHATTAEPHAAQRCPFALARHATGAQCVPCGRRRAALGSK